MSPVYLWIWFSWFPFSTDAGWIKYSLPLDQPRCEEYLREYVAMFSTRTVACGTVPPQVGHPIVGEDWFNSHPEDRDGCKPSGDLEALCRDAPYRVLQD